MIPKYNFDIPFKIIIPMRNEWETGEIHPEHDAIIWYTDGSKTKAGVGAGAYCTGPKIKIHTK